MDNKQDQLDHLNDLKFKRERDEQRVVHTQVQEPKKEEMKVPDNNQQEKENLNIHRDEE